MDEGTTTRRGPNIVAGGAGTKNSPSPTWRITCCEMSIRLGLRRSRTAGTAVNRLISLRAQLSVAPSIEPRTSTLGRRWGSDGSRVAAANSGRSNSGGSNSSTAPLTGCTNAFLGAAFRIRAVQGAPNAATMRSAKARSTWISPAAIFCSHRSRFTDSPAALITILERSAPGPGKSSGRFAASQVRAASNARWVSASIPAAASSSAVAAMAETTGGVSHAWAELTQLSYRGSLAPAAAFPIVRSRAVCRTAEVHASPRALLAASSERRASACSSRVSSSVRLSPAILSAPTGDDSISAGPVWMFCRRSAVAPGTSR